jgi:hypothetical protein
MVAFFEWVRRLIETSDVWVESEGSQNFAAWYFGIGVGILLIIGIASEVRKRLKKT